MSPSRPVLPTVLASLLLLLAASCTETRRGDELELRAYLEATDTGGWSLVGTVLEGRQPVSGARVWVVLGGGDELSLPSVTSDAQGLFTVPSVPRRVGDLRVDELRLEATLERVVDGATVLLQGTRELTVPRSRPPGFLTFSWMVLLPGTFFLSLLVPLVGELGRRRHLCSIALACSFTLLMALHVALAFRYAAELSTQQAVSGEPFVTSSGFAFLFDGTFVEGAPADLVLAFSPPAVGTAVFSGFGAPLWVLLLSIFGAGLLTISILTGEIGQRGRWDDPEYLRVADQLLIRHQTFVLFAPLGGIFVYQLLLAAGAAGEPITVGIAVLGAGATLPALLRSAVERAGQLLAKEPPAAR